eukprot:jgi/Astpho2/4703/fgenesh1_pg.00067_%23_186_t
MAQVEAQRFGRVQLSGRYAPGLAGVRFPASRTVELQKLFCLSRVRDSAKLESERGAISIQAKGRSLQLDKQNSRAQVKRVLQELHHKVQLDLFSLKSSRLALCYPDLLLPQQWHPEVLQDTLHFYKVVAVQFRKLLSVFDGTTQYQIGKKLYAKQGAGSWAPLGACLYAYRTPQQALSATFPAHSRLLGSPKVLIQLRASGRAYRHDNGMWALAACTPSLLITAVTDGDIAVPASYMSAIATD